MGSTTTAVLSYIFKHQNNKQDIDTSYIRVNCLVTIMKHYWINIDRCADRREFMEKQFADYGIENYRISAETPETTEDYRIVRNDRSKESQAEVSCVISHLKAIKRGYDDGDDFFCVMEDDMKIVNLDFKKILDHIKMTEDKDKVSIEALQLYTSGGPSLIRMFKENTKGFTDYKTYMQKRVASYPCAGYYVMSRKGAIKLLELYVISPTSYDLSLYEWTVADNLVYRPIETYLMTYPMAHTEIRYGSTLHMKHLFDHEMSNAIVKKIWSINNQLQYFTKQ